MDEINEQTESMKQVQETLSAPIGAAVDFDEVFLYFLKLIFRIENYIFILNLPLQDELEAQLGELEGAYL